MTQTQQELNEEDQEIQLTEYRSKQQKKGYTGEGRKARPLKDKIVQQENQSYLTKFEKCIGFIGLLFFIGCIFVILY